MKENHHTLYQSPLFAGVEPCELDKLLSCLDARERQYQAGEVVLMAGQAADRVGVVVRGRVQIIREEFSGSRTIVAELEPGDLFAEAFACASGERKTLPVTVMSVTESAVLLLDYRKIIATCPSACRFHVRVIQNMIAVLADRNLLLNRRLGHLAKRTTRDKLLSYLSEQASVQGTCFTIPFNRQELADYLCVERSAMSAVLSKLRSEGVLIAERNRFTLLNWPH